MDFARSALFCPGNRPDLVAKAVASGADAVVVDLEDAVPPSLKSAARDDLSRLPDTAVPIVVRVNGAEPEMLWSDVSAVARSRAVGIVLPKAEDRDLLVAIGGAFSVAEVDAGRPPGALAIIPLIETASGVLNAAEILSAPRVRAVMFGSGEQGDLFDDLGGRWTPDGAALEYARLHVLLAARAAGVALALDGVFMDFKNLDALRVECEVAATAGYGGKAAIHPGQIAVIHEAFTPAAEEVERQRRIIDEFESALAEGSASIAVDGRMVDEAVAKVARSVIRRYEAARSRDRRAFGDQT